MLKKLVFKIYETFFKFRTAKKGFEGNGSERVPAVRSFLGFADFENNLFKHVDAFGSF
jgi:hypothetical protein